MAGLAKWKVVLSLYQSVSHAPQPKQKRNLGYVYGGYSIDDLVQATDANFYGTSSIAPNGGLVFRIAPASHRYDTLFKFDGTNGASPKSLFQAVDGSLYGVTSGGGNAGQGTVFKMTLSGKLTTLYSFLRNGTLPSQPQSLLQGQDGNFYGTTLLPYGTIFKITPKGQLTVLHKFNPG